MISTMDFNSHVLNHLLTEYFYFLSLFLGSLRMELDEMKKKLSEKSGVTDDTPLNSHHQDTGLTSQHKGGTVSLNGCKRTSTIRGSVENSSNAPKELTQEELQAANCVIA